MQIGTDLAEKDVRRDADRTGKAFADLLAQRLTRSKWLAQKNAGQKIAREVVRRSPHLGENNVETVTNTLSTKNARLAAFNTLASGFEEAWSDIGDEDVDKAIEWFLAFWETMVRVRPELGRLSLTERQKCRKESLVGSAIAIQGYIRLARRMYDEGHPLSLLEELDGETDSFFAWNNPTFQREGIIVPAIDKQGETKLTLRNSHQTRRAMGELLAVKVGVPAPVAAAA